MGGIKQEQHIQQQAINNQHK